MSSTCSLRYSGNIVTSFSPYYCTYMYYVDSASELLSVRKACAQAIADVVSWIPANASNIQKAKAIHDWLCRNVRYDVDYYNTGKDQ